MGCAFAVAVPAASAASPALLISCHFSLHSPVKFSPPSSPLSSSSSLLFPCDYNASSFSALQKRRRTRIVTRSRSCVRATAEEAPSRKLLVVDLQEMLRVASEDETRQFSERVQVDRDKSKHPTYLLFSSMSGYAASMQSIRDVGLVEPNALITLNGSEIYQEGYRTPDPYFAKQLGTGWTPRPIEWTVGKFFADEIDVISVDKEDMAVSITCKGDRPNIDFCTRVSKRLDEMGISARVVLDQENDSNVLVVPTAGSPALVVSFVQTMIGVNEENTFVFGGDGLLNQCVQGKRNVGLTSSATNQNWEAFDGRVYVSKEEGVNALMDGLIHHAVF